MQERGYAQHFKLHDMVLRMIFGASEYMCSFDTYQFNDYSKVVSTRFDHKKEAQRRKEIFPTDCEKAFRMGAGFAESMD